MNQLERDLLKNAKHRLRLWIKDTAMRCEAVDVGPKIATVMIITALTEEIAYAFATLGASREDFLIVMQRQFDIELRKKAREAK